MWSAADGGEGTLWKQGVKPSTCSVKLSDLFLKTSLKKKAKAAVENKQIKKKASHLRRHTSSKQFNDAHQIKVEFDQSLKK